MTRVEIGATLALLNALLNATSAVLIVCGRWAIRRKLVEHHKRFMMAAFVTSTLFLVSYLTRAALTGAHAFPHGGVLRVVYLAVLLSHMILAIAVVPLVLTSLFFGLKRRLESHKKAVRWAYPIWLYVSVTGVVVYVMLYHL